MERDHPILRGYRIVGRAAWAFGGRNRFVETDDSDATDQADIKRALVAIGVSSSDTESRHDFEAAMGWWELVDHLTGRRENETFSHFGDLARAAVSGVSGKLMARRIESLVADPEDVADSMEFDNSSYLMDRLSKTLGEQIMEDVERKMQDGRPGNGDPFGLGMNGKFGMGSHESDDDDDDDPASIDIQ